MKKAKTADAGGKLVDKVESILGFDKRSCDDAAGTAQEFYDTVQAPRRGAGGGRGEFTA